MTVKTDIHFCYRVAAEAGFAHDADGNDTSMVSKISFEEANQITPEFYSEKHEELRFTIAKMLHISADLVEKISYDEFIQEEDE